MSITAAGQPGIEDVLLGAIPGLPKVNLHNKVLSPTLGGEEFLLPFRQAVNDELDAPFVLVIEGSIPNEEINGEGYWTSFGNDEATGEPLTLNWWIDRLAPKAWGVGRSVPAPPTAASTRWREIRPAAWASRTTSLGLSLGGRAADRQRSRLPRPARELHGDASAWLLYQAAGLAPTIPLDDALQAAVDLRQDGPRGLRPGRLLRAGRLREGLQLAEVPGEDRRQGPVVNCNVPEARLDGGHRRVPERGRNLHRLHDARVPGQVHAVHGCAARGGLSSAPTGSYGPVIRRLRGITNTTVNKEPGGAAADTS